MSINQDLERDVLVVGWTFGKFTDGPHFARMGSGKYGAPKCFFDDDGDFICDPSWVPGSIVRELLHRSAPAPVVEPAPSIVDVIGPTVTIDRRTYDLLCLASAKLDALMAEGVDNWEGYGHAVQAMHDAEEYGTKPSR